jgi:hypothetical protein
LCVQIGIGDAASTTATVVVGPHGALSLATICASRACDFAVAGASAAIVLVIDRFASIHTRPLGPSDLKARKTVVAYLAGKPDLSAL